MKTLLLITATLLLSQHAFASEDYLCTITSSRTDLSQVVAGIVDPYHISTDLHLERLEGVSSGDSFMASIVRDEETQSQVLDIAINYAVGGSSYQFEERLYKEIKVQGARVINTKKVDESSKIPLLKATKTNIAGVGFAYGSIKKNANGFSGNLNLSLSADGKEFETHDNWYSKVIKFDCKPML